MKSLVIIAVVSYAVIKGAFAIVDTGTESINKHNSKIENVVAQATG